MAVALVQGIPFTLLADGRWMPKADFGPTGTTPHEHAWAVLDTLAGALNFTSRDAYLNTLADDPTEIRRRITALDGDIC